MAFRASRLLQWRWPLGILILGLGAAVAGAWWQQRQNERHVRERLEVAAEQVADQLYRRLRSYEFGLIGARGAVAAVGSSTADVPHESFRRFAGTVALQQNFPGARGLGFVRRVPRQREALFVAAVRREYNPAFRIHEVTPELGNPVTSPLANRFVVQFIEPAQGNEGAEGLDLATGVHRRAALLAAMRDGAPRITAPLTLSQAASFRDRSFLLFLPVYGDGTPAQARREADTVGWTYMSLVIDEVLSGFDLERGSLTMALHDVTEPGMPVGFYAGVHWSATTPALRSHRQTLEIYGRRWELEMQALPAFVERMHQHNPATLGAAVAAFSVLMALLLATRVRAVHRIMQANAMLQGALQQLHASEVKVRHTADLLEQLIESAPDPIWTKDREGRWTTMNSAAAAVIGRSRESVIGLRDHDVLPADYADVVEAQNQRILREGEVLRTEDKVFDAGRGEPRIFYSIKAPLRAADGRITGMLGIARDITQRKAAEARLAELNITLEQQVQQRTAELQMVSARERAIVASAGSAIITTDLSGVITSFNPAAEAKFRTKAAQAIGRSMLDFQDADELRENGPESAAPLSGHAHALPRALQRVLQRHDMPPGAPRQRTEWTYVRADGTRFPGLLRSSLLRDGQGQVIGFLAMIADLSERRRMEDQLRQRTHEAEAASRAKSAFLAHMSHELRTPLNAVIGLSQLLQQRNTLPDDVARFIGHIHQAGEQLLALVSDVLDLSRFEAGELQLEHRSFELPPLLDAVRVLVQPQADAKGLDLRLDLPADLPVQLIGDASRLKQLLLNLVDNAVKFTPSGSVSLGAGQLARQGSCSILRFEVVDTGIGIPPEQQSRIFEPFTQAENYTTRRFGGTGLGLPIVQRLVGLMGGELALHSAPGEGTTVSVTLRFDLVDIQ